MRSMIGALTMMALATVALAQAAPEVSAVPSLTAGGRGEARVRPDLGVVTLGASAQAKEAAKAQAEVNQVMQRTVARLKELGIAGEQIQTQAISLWPEYRHDQQGRGEPRMVGYRASNTVSVRLKDLGRVGDVIDAAVEAGANQLQGVSFELQDDRAARQQALRQAIADARAKGETMAAAMDVRLVSVLDVNEGPLEIGRPPIPMARTARLAAAEAATPVEPGQVQVDAEVTIRWRIAPAK